MKLRIFSTTQLPLKPRGKGAERGNGKRADLFCAHSSSSISKSVPLFGGTARYSSISLRPHWWVKEALSALLANWLDSVFVFRI